MSTLDLDCNITGTPSILYQNCDCDFPWWLCPVANVCGLCSTCVWFLVLLPQVYRSARHRSVEGLSVGWAIMNFTAALNNCFFVFKIGTLPLYSYISAVYMPILEALLLSFFVFFTPHTRTKWLVTFALCVGWSALCVLQLAFDVYSYLEWLSIALWSAETFPQVWLNMRRRSTRGLSTQMVALTTVGKSTDFVGPYVLVIPLQYIVMAFFSSSVAVFGTIQVIWYWNQVPVDDMKDVDEDNSSDEQKLPIETVPPTSVARPSVQTEVLRLPTSTTCHVLRCALLVLLTAELCVFAMAIVWRTHIWWFLLCPIGTYAAIFGYYPLYHFWLKHQ